MGDTFIEMEMISMAKLNPLENPTFTTTDTDTASKKTKKTHFRQFIRMELEDLKTPLMWRACFGEAIGTFLLCFYTIAFTAHRPGDDPPSLLQISLAISFFLYVIISTLAGVSGCHINPAFSFAFIFLRYISVSRGILYIIFQCWGAILGSYVTKVVLPPDMVGGLGVILPGKNVTDEQALLMEFIITWFVGFSVCALLDKGRNDLTFSVPLAISFVVAANVLLAGAISGACMNPARALGPVVIMGKYEKQWIYWIGPMSGATVGALCYDKLFRTTTNVSDLFSSCLPVACFPPGNRTLEVPAKKEASKMVVEWETEP